MQLSIKNQNMTNASSKLPSNKNASNDLIMSSQSSSDTGQNEIHKRSQSKNKKDDSNEDIEERIKNLILMTGGKGPKRWKQRKKEYMKKLENDNAELKNIIVDLQQKINAYQSQKTIVLDQLRYFQGCLDQAAPFILQQNENKNQKE